MPKDICYGKTLRKSFARSTEIQDMPNLLEIQKKSYKWFLDTGLREVFRDVDAVTDYSGNLELSFVDYSMDEKPKYSEEECKARDATYAAPLKVSVRLRNKETEEIKEQEIFMGDFPLMTDGGTFVINGAERVIVSQIVRSPGVYYDKKTDKAQISTYGTTVIPYHGAWLEYETDANDLFYVRIDKNRKLPVTLFLKAMGRYDADKPCTWLSCLPDPVAGCVTSEQLKEVFANDERIPWARNVVCPIDKIYENGVKLHSRSYVVIMTRGHALDAEAVRVTEGMPGAYYGMIGSRSKIAAVRAKLLAEGVNAAHLDRIYQPIGLPIKAETPNEIAVSIMSEIIAVKYGADVKRLRGETAAR